jgi:fido (protein-threonine AMPylation protein)
MSETDLFQEPDDATPLDPALRADLVQTWVTTRGDLNVAEEENIIKGAAWARRRRGGAETLLNDDFSKNLHTQLFGEVWKWAGKYRESELNIGIAPHLVTAEMPAMFDIIVSGSRTTRSRLMKSPYGCITASRRYTAFRTAMAAMRA